MPNRPMKDLDQAEAAAFLNSLAGALRLPLPPGGAIVITIGNGKWRLEPKAGGRLSVDQIDEAD